MKKVMVVALFGFFATYLLLWPRAIPHQSSASIREGMSISEIAEELKKEELIISSSLFKSIARITGKDTSLRSGHFSFPQKASLFDILHILTEPTSPELSFTVPEGYSVFDIDKKLHQEDLIAKGDFIRTAKIYEGYLFPDTYFIFRENFTPEQLIEKMRANFEKKIDKEMRHQINQSGRTLGEIVSMASILEREVRTSEDFAIVSGILWKRLDNGWPIQADATLLYGKNSPQITRKDLASDDPYNTRKLKGLPPTPIGNPGIATIRASIFPQESPYWFYLTDERGNVHYASTNEEHNENRRKYLE